MTSFRRSDLSLLPRLLKTARLPLKNIVTIAVMENMEKKQNIQPYGLGPIAAYIFVANDRNRLCAYNFVGEIQRHE